VTDAGAALSDASRTSGGGEAAPPSTGGESGALWAGTLQSLANVVAHDLRNALNAVAVNLEVVRSRSARGAEPSAIAPFAGLAATNFETAAGAAEALLSFVRPEPGRVDIAAVVTRLARLLAVRGGAGLQVTDQSDGRATSAATPDIVRAVVARSVLAAVGTDEGAACEIAVDDGIFLRVTGATRVPPLPDSELVAAALEQGIRITARERSIELRFPAVDQRTTPNVPS
jgi:signal transduction histidine kinase